MKQFQFTPVSKRLPWYYTAHRHTFRQSELRKPVKDAALSVVHTKNIILSALDVKEATRPFWIQGHLFWNTAIWDIQEASYNTQLYYILLTICVSICASTSHRALGLLHVELLRVHGNDGCFRLSHQSRYYVKANAVANMPNDCC